MNRVKSNPLLEAYPVCASFRPLKKDYEAKKPAHSCGKTAKATGLHHPLIRSTIAALASLYPRIMEGIKAGETFHNYLSIDNQ